MHVELSASLTQNRVLRKIGKPVQRVLDPNYLDPNLKVFQTAEQQLTASSKSILANTDEGSIEQQLAVDCALV